MFYTKEILLHGKSIRYTLAFTVLSLLGIGDLDALLKLTFHALLVFCAYSDELQ